MSLPFFSVFFRFLPFSSVFFRFFRFFPVFFPFSSVFFRFFRFFSVFFVSFSEKKTGRHRSRDPFCETLTDSGRLRSPRVSGSDSLACFLALPARHGQARSSSNWSTRPDLPCTGVALWPIPVRQQRQDFPRPRDVQSLTHILVCDRVGQLQNRKAPKSPQNRRKYRQK